VRDPVTVMPGFGERLRAARRLRDPRVAALALCGALGIAMLVTGLAYAADQAANGENVARNVSVGGRNVSSVSKAKLAEILAEVDRRYATTEVLVGDPDTDGFVTDAGTIGLRVDPVATAERVMAVGRTGSLPGRWWSWLGSFRGTRRSDLALSVDRGAVAQVVMDKGKQGENPPTEASIQLERQGKLVGVAGKAGEGIDPGMLADDLLKVAKEGTPIKVKVRRGRLAPRFTKSDADALAKRAELLVAKPLPLAAGTSTANLSTGTLRGLLSSVPGANGLDLRVDEDAAAAAAEKALTAAGAGAQAVEPTFKVEAGNAITLVPGTPGRGCCGPEAGKAIAAAILQRPDEPVPLTLVDKKPKLTNEQAGALGVKEEVSTYATKHPCCAPRVTNIHRMADLIRGQVIPPGQSFSINAFVGERTTEKGFVEDKVIADGRFELEVGGGVSQFATTLFNAAWFAGLEFGEYQSHSLYISRYPKGRDATLGLPHPDLVIKNPTPYGIVIWPTYTATEIRVALYSTKWVDVKATGQDTRPNGSCTIYFAKRERTFLDGKVVNDATKAQYRAGEGQNCADDQPPPETTTTKVGATTSTSTTKPPPGPTTTKKPAAPTTTTIRR